VSERELAEFALRVRDLCDQRIAGLAEQGANACGDCPAWTLRAEAAKLLNQEATA